MAATSQRFILITGALGFGAMGFFLAWLGFDILSVGTVTYTARPLPPRTVSPETAPFEYYYQVVFFLSGGAFCLLMALASILALLGQLAEASGFGPHPMKIKSTGKAIVYFALPVGLVWIALRLLRSILL